MGTFSDGFFDTLHGHFRCAGFFHLEPFPAEHNKARSKYEEKNKDFFETMKLPDCEIRRILMTTSSMTRLLFVGRNFYMLHYISLS